MSNSRTLLRKHHTAEGKRLKPGLRGRSIIKVSILGHVSKAYRFMYHATKGGRWHRMTRGDVMAYLQTQPKRTGLMRTDAEAIATAKRMAEAKAQLL